MGVRELPSLVNGAGLRTLSLRGSWVRIPPPASILKIISTTFVFQKKGNVEKVNQNVIKGLFGMYLEVSFIKKIDIKKFEIELQKVAKKHKMDVSTHHEIDLEKNIAIFGTKKTLSLMAKKAKIAFALIDEKEQSKAESKLIDVCKKYDVDLIVLARYMKILTPNFVWRYPNRIINIHPSLLPAFPGALAYAQAYERGTKIVGVTAHYVTENLDQGPIIFQDSFNVNPEDSLESIKKKGQKLEADTLLRAVKMHLTNKLEVRWRKVHTK